MKRSSTISKQSSTGNNLINDEFILSIVGRLLQTFDLQFKGDGAVGKSSLSTRFMQGTFDKQQIYDPTIEDAYYIKRNVDGKPTHLELIDSAGQEGSYHNFLSFETFQQTLRSTFMRRSFGFIFVFDVTNGESLKALKEYYDQIVRIKISDEGYESNCDSLRPPFPCIFLGNKIDLLLKSPQLAKLSEKVQVPLQEEKRDKKLLRKLDKEVRSFIEREIVGINSGEKSSFHLPLFWTSAKENINVVESFEAIVREMRNMSLPKVKQRTKMSKQTPNPSNTTEKRRWSSFSSSKKSIPNLSIEKPSSYPSRRGSFLFSSFNCDNDMEDLV